MGEGPESAVGWGRRSRSRRWWVRELGRLERVFERKV
jgi:hypothetical protein